MVKTTINVLAGIAIGATAALLFLKYVMPPTDCNTKLLYDKPYDDKYGEFYKTATSDTLISQIRICH